MKRTLFLSLLSLLLFPFAPPISAQARFGYLSCDSLLREMPEYVTAQGNLKELRDKYTLETVHNEERFHRMFADYMEGQKDFPQLILLKRQRELQDEMDRSLRFRNEVERLLSQAERELMAPVRAMLDSAMRSVGRERGYDYILSLDGGSFPYISAERGEDAAPFVRQKLEAMRHE